MIATCRQRRDLMGPSSVKLGESTLVEQLSCGAELSEPKYKTVPKGYDADQTLGEWCADRLVKVAPVERWFATHLA